MYEQRRAVFDLPSEFGHRDITDEIGAWVADAGIEVGFVTLQAVGSTAALTTIEYEPGALADLRRALEALAPVAGRYEHNERWGDGNGFSHLRSALLKTGLTVPVVDGRLQLGTWQQIVLLNFDNRERRRQVVGVVAGQ